MLILSLALQLPPPDSQPRRPLAPVTITAERPRAAPPPVAVTTVAPVVVQTTAGSSAYDVLRRAAGLEVHEQGQGPGFTSNVVVRGFNSDHSADVLLVVDGVPINAPVHGHVEGFSDWNVLLPLAVSSARVLHGGASPLYGDFSLAGVVEVFTAADADRTVSALSSSSFGDIGYAMRTGVRREGGGTMLAFDVRRQAGWQPNAAASLGNVAWRGWRRLFGGRLEGGLQTYASRWDSPGFVSVARYNRRDFGAAVDTTDGGWSRRVLGHVRFARSLGHRAAIEATAWGQASAYRMRLNIPGQSLTLRQTEETDDRSGAGGRVQLVRRLPFGEVIVGGEGRLDAATYGLDATLGGQFITREHAYDARFASASGFARWRYVVGSRLGLDLGARLDAMHYRTNNTLRTLGWRQATQVVPTPKLGARYVLADGRLLKASVSRGFRGAPGVIADPARAPFLAWATEVGAEWTTGAWSLEGALFRMDVDNERIFNPLALTVSSAGRSRRQGVDVRARGRIGDRLGLSATATWNDARFLGAPGGDTVRVPPSPDFHDHLVPMRPGDPVPGVARVTGSVRADAAMGRTVAGATWRLLGSFVPIGEPGVSTRSASVLDLDWSVPVGRLVVDLALQNVLDLRYVENRASGFITPGIPRVLRLTVRTPVS